MIDYFFTHVKLIRFFALDNRGLLTRGATETVTIVTSNLPLISSENIEYHPNFFFPVTLPTASAKVELQPCGTLKLLRNEKNVTIDCIAYGKPKPTVKWMKGNEQIPRVDNLDRNRVVQMTLEATEDFPWKLTSRLYLRISGTTYGVAGNYTCSVHNGVGRNKSLNETIEVLCKSIHFDSLVAVFFRCAYSLENEALLYYQVDR